MLLLTPPPHPSKTKQKKKTGDVTKTVGTFPGFTSLALYGVCDCLALFKNVDI